MVFILFLGLRKNETNNAVFYFKKDFCNFN
mgnify:CR=1 FL=1